MSIQIIVLAVAAALSAGQKAVFIANDDSHGHEPWVTDGTEKGTRLLKDLCPGEYGSGIDRLASSGRFSWFVGYVDDAGRQVIGRTDGTIAGTVQTATGSRRRPHGHIVTRLVSAQETLYYVADDADGVDGIWSLKNARSRVVRLVKAKPKEALCGLAVTDKGLVFVKYVDSDAARKRYLCRLEPVVPGGEKCSEIRTRSNELLDTCELTPFGRAVYFSSESSLWKMEGPTTTLVKEFPRTARIGEIVPLNGRLLFGLWTTETETLWSTDGTTAGTVALATVSTKSREIDENFILRADFTLKAVVQKGVLYFVPHVGEPGSYSQLWRSDGTAAGTKMVRDLFPGIVNATIRQLYPGRDALFLVANDDDHGDELWKSDGTAAGTVRVKRIGLGLAGMAAKEKAKKEQGRGR